MATIVVVCNGVNWQADFEPLVPRLYTYFSKCFWGERDYEELRHKAVLYFMHRFMKHWAPGKEIKLATSFIVWHARYGRCGIVPLPNRHHQSVKTRRLGCLRLKNLRAKKDRVLENVDWRMMLAKLREQERRIVGMYIARFGWEEIKAKLGVSDYKIKFALSRAVELLGK